MIRGITSIALALAIAAVLTGSSCVACFADSPVKSKGCCSKAHKTCHQSSKSQAQTHPECSPKPPDLTNFDKPADHAGKLLAPAVIPDPVLVSAVAPTVKCRPPASVDPYYPPDLCLLNSVLTI